MAEITHFAQWDQESLYEAWEGYKDMLKKCPHHGLQGWVVIQTFSGGLHPQYKNDIIGGASGALMNKTYQRELPSNLHSIKRKVFLTCIRPHKNPNRYNILKTGITTPEMICFPTHTMRVRGSIQISHGINHQIN